MLETERSSDEALRQSTFVRLYRGALEIENPDRRRKAAYIILLAGRLGLRTGEIQHVREAWIDWERGEIAIPRHDPCGCMNCWVAARRKAADDDESIRDEIVKIVEKNEDFDSDDELEDHVDILLENMTPEEDEETETTKQGDDRNPLEILYEERWQPKYERSARRIPFGYSRRLTCVIMVFFQHYDCLEITQPTMNNYIEEAAENAKGVDPEKITLRGLRATAATNYTTFVRSPKVIQDLMGWTRIETGSRYIRRAGGFTTDVVYEVFQNRKFGPTMIPDEPKYRYPLIANPIPYQKEPWEPMLYTKDERFERAKQVGDEPQQVIHPRSENSPPDIPYDPTDHTIRTHEDYESEFIERADGKLAFERPTVYEYIESRDEPKLDAIKDDEDLRQYESEEEWEQANFDDSDDSVFSTSGDIDPKKFEPSPPLHERLQSSDNPIVKQAANDIGSERLSAAIIQGKRNALFLPFVALITGSVATFLLTETLLDLFIILLLGILLIPAVILAPIVYQLYPDLKKMYLET